MQPFLKESTLYKAGGMILSGWLTYDVLIPLFVPQKYEYESFFEPLRLCATAAAMYGGWRLVKKVSVTANIEDAEEVFDSVDKNFISRIAQEIDSPNDFYRKIENAYSTSPYPLVSAFNYMVDIRINIRKSQDLAILAKNKDDSVSHRCDELLTKVGGILVDIDKILNLLKQHPLWLQSYSLKQAQVLHNEQLDNRRLTNLILLTR